MSEERDSRLDKLLRADADAEPLRPVWPAVQSRLRRRALPSFDLPFAFGTGAAVAAGIWLGLTLGAPRVPGASSTVLSASPDVATDLWTSLGATVATGAELSDLYDLEAEPEGGAS